VSQNHITQLKYRPEIDGLRAIAVLSVFLFHLNHQWLPGGFVGVDIFFVISGYLITSLLYIDFNAGKFSLSRFYQRRIARIFPALFTVALVTIVGAAFIYSPLDFARAGSSLIAAVLSVANIKYAFQGNYFTASPDAQPYLHYWSLSVEEQFYMLFPLILYLIFRYGRRYLTAFLAAVGIASLIVCVVFTHMKPVWAFYLLPTRAWELCSGSILATLPFPERNERTFSLLSWAPVVGLFLIGSSLGLLHEGSDFPGWKAIIPVVGAAAIILPAPQRCDAVHKLLSHPMMVQIGKMSYSLYLWHWPVFSLIDYRFYLLPEGSRLLLKVSLSVVLTIFTFYLVENRSRIFLNRPDSCRLAYMALTACLAVSIPLGFTIRKNNYIDAKVADVANGGLVFPGKSGASSVVLMGDSNGCMYGKLLKAICADLGDRLTVISVDGGDSLPSRSGAGENLWLSSLNVVRKTKPDYLVVANLWSLRLREDPDRLVVALDQLKPYVKHIILLNQPPTLPSEATRVSIRGGCRPPFRETVKVNTERQKVNNFLACLQSSNVSVIDTARYFKSKEGDIIYVDENGRQLFYDCTHLSDYGAEKLRGVLEQTLRS
jgi:peptidoglycan/LPS O-acetylase OafA/YrhL